MQLLRHNMLHRQCHPVSLACHLCCNLPSAGAVPRLQLNSNNAETNAMALQDREDSLHDADSGTDLSSSEQEEEQESEEEEEENQDSQTPWDRPCSQPFVWDGERDVMVLVDPSTSQRGWCQARVGRETAHTLHFCWPGT